VRWWYGRVKNIIGVTQDVLEQALVMQLADITAISNLVFKLHNECEAFGGPTWLAPIRNAWPNE